MEELILEDGNQFDSLLPAKVITKNGSCFNPRDDIWKYKDALLLVRINFNFFKVKKDLQHSLKFIFIWYVENCSPYYVENLHYYLCLFFDHVFGITNCHTSKIDASMVQNYKMSLSKRDSYMLGYITSPLRKMHDMNLFGIDDDAMYYLDKLKIQGNIKGESVLTMDPHRGPFTDIEFNSINLAITRAYEDERIDLQDFLLAWLFMSMGHRPIQYAAMKVCDFMPSINTQGDITYILNIPRAKLRGRPFRSAKKQRVIVQKIGEMFTQHINKVKERYAGR